MATIRWTPRAIAVRQVCTTQITADDAATSYIMTIGNVAVTVAGAGTGVNATASALQAALTAEGHPYFAAITWTVSTDTVTGTGSVLGEPFTAAGTVSGGTGTVSHTAEATAAESLNHFSVAGNWSSNTVPTTADEIIFDKGSVPMLWDIDQNALSLDLVRTDMAYTGYIGLNPGVFFSGGADVAGYPEYRETHFKIDANIVEIGRTAGNTTGTGQGRVNIDNGDTGTPVCTVFNTAASPRDAGQLAVDYVANDAQAVLVVDNAPGGVGVAVRKPGTTATLSTISMTGANPSSRLVVGEGVTWTSYRQDAGSSLVAAAADVTAMWINGGTVETVGEEWTIGQLDIYRGKVALSHYDSTTPATLTNVWNGGTLDTTRSQRTRTLATVKQFPESTVLFDPGYITITTLTWENERLAMQITKG